MLLLEMETPQRIQSTRLLPFPQTPFIQPQYISTTLNPLNKRVRDLQHWRDYYHRFLASYINGTLPFNRSYTYDTKGSITLLSKGYRYQQERYYNVLIRNLLLQFITHTHTYIYIINPYFFYINQVKRTMNIEIIVNQTLLQLLYRIRQQYITLEAY